MSGPAVLPLAISESLALHITPKSEISHSAIRHYSQAQSFDYGTMVRIFTPNHFSTMGYSRFLIFMPIVAVLQNL
jgi:hypothetical protein